MNMQHKADNPRDKTVALVLGSGGARGYAHIGVIEELEARGYRVVAISGCSMGALVGGAPAAASFEAIAERRDHGVYFSSLAAGDVFRGGFYIDTATTAEAQAAAASLLADATWAYYVFGDGNGTHAYGGSTYYTLAEYDPNLSIEWGVVADPAGRSPGR